LSKVRTCYLSYYFMIAIYRLKLMRFSFHFKIVFLTGGTELIGEYSTQDRTATISISALNLKKYRTIKVWVAVVLDHDLRGTDTFVKCNLDSQILM
jgi:hypothetical protein